MLRSPLQIRCRALPALISLTAICLSWACARSSTTSAAEPEGPRAESEATPSESATNDSAASTKAVQKRPHEPLESFLESRFAGVRVSVNSDGSLSIRLRGANSFMAGTEPLYVIDGSPIRPGPRGGLIGINPYDIESIEVLKHPPQTTLYGVRGANGVILITTRRPDQ